MTNTVIITGASQGIGKATALLFARHNYVTTIMLCWQLVNLTV